MSDVGPEFDASEFVDQMGRLFEREHAISPPPPPIDHSYPSLHHFGSHIHLNEDEHFESRPEPSLDEKIERAEGATEIERLYERSTNKNDRERENFGQRFKIAVNFAIAPHSFMSDTSLFEVGLTNRLHMYRYLQQRGLALVDDTGMSEKGKVEPKGPTRGYLMLPDSIDRGIYYSFEDEIRNRVPFTRGEFATQELTILRDEGRNTTPQDFAVEPKAMRELVDFFSLDERFMDLFAQSEELFKARRAKPRASLEDEPLTKVVEVTEPASKPPLNDLETFVRDDGLITGRSTEFDPEGFYIKKDVDLRDINQLLAKFKTDPAYKKYPPHPQS